MEPQYKMKFAILKDMGYQVPGNVDKMSLKELEESYQMVLGNTREKMEDDMVRMYTILGTNLNKMIKEDPSFEERLFEGLPEDFKLAFRF